jgi:hypothetical protein
MPYNDSKGPKMESAKQERKDLLRDNPVVRDMDSSRPWMSKHFQSTMGSAMKMNHEGSPAEKELVGNQKNLPQHLQDEILAAPEMKMDGMSMKKMGDGPEMAYGKGPEMDYGKGPKMSALHENHVDPPKEEEEVEGGNQPTAEDRKPKQPQKFYHRIERKLERKPMMPKIPKDESK